MYLFFTSLIIYFNGLSFTEISKYFNCLLLLLCPVSFHSTHKIFDKKKLQSSKTKET